MLKIGSWLGNRPKVFSRLHTFPYRGEWETLLKLEFDFLQRHN